MHEVVLCPKNNYDVSHIFQPLEDSIRENLLPAIIGRKISDMERRILALPVRFGGIGVLNPVETSNIEYDTSVKITSDLKKIIYNQEKTLENLDENRVNNIINKSKKIKRNDSHKNLKPSKH